MVPQDEAVAVAPLTGREDAAGMGAVQTAGAAQAACALGPPDPRTLTATAELRVK